MERRKTAIRRLFESHRKHGSPWCWVEDGSYHSQARSLSLVIPYFRELLNLRLKKKAMAEIPQDAGITIDLAAKKILHEGKPTSADNKNPRTGYLPSKTLFDEWAKQDIGIEKYGGKAPSPEQ